MKTRGNCQVAVELLFGFSNDGLPTALMCPAANRVAEVRGRRYAHWKEASNISQPSFRTRPLSQINDTRPPSIPALRS